MNIYKRKSDGDIFCTLDGDRNIEGFEWLGFDESMTDSTKKFVTGYDKKNKCTIFDSDGMAAQGIRDYNAPIFFQISEVLRFCINAQAIDDQEELNKQREIYNELKKKLNG